MQHKRKTNHELFEEDRNKLAIGYRLSAIGYRLILCVLVSVFAVTAFAQPYRTGKDGSAVWDEATNLVWARCSIGQTWDKKTCIGKAEEFNFKQVELLPEGIKFDIAGFNDWVVPTVRQLETLRMCPGGFSGDVVDIQDGGPLVRNSCVRPSLSPTIDSSIFPKTQEQSYWSLSPDLRISSDAWHVYFRYGYVGSTNRRFSQYVRLVRASQLSGGEAALAFPIKLVGMNKTELIKNQARFVEEYEAQERRDQAGRDELHRRDAPARQSRQMCEAQKQTCVTSCPRFVDGRGVRFDFPETPCRNRCESVSCY